ncbi:membrane protein [Marinobacterium zhoushanense]|uniref:Membrane protein n=1 Tax=Marinobacterium zhoushanense TaxID=1679163 RepID=A0ABQ1K3T0_9GAMM|nr:membrane protein [Marinobacterium zhoushanense]
MISWMAWTLPVAVFFSVIAFILMCMTVYEVRSPCVERKGFLPIATTRGDRLFIGLLSSAYLHLVFLGLTDLNLWIPLAISVIWLAVILRWG